jgi:hypothetical protein
MGPKHGIARGVAVFGTSTSIPVEAVNGPLSDSGRLVRWSLSQGVVLADDPTGLEVLDLHLDEWAANPTHYEHVDLGNQVGIYLGNIIVKHVTGAKWKVWPNGHPVISLASAREMDVVAMVSERLRHSGPSLTSIYASAS